MTDPVLELNSSPDNFINKSVHTTDGVLIGNIHAIDKDSVVVKRDVVTTIYYHVPGQKLREWDGHALWLNIDDKESKRYILPTDSKNIKTSSMAFDLDESIIDKLHAEIESQEITLNTYVIQIIRRFLEWDRFEPKSDIIPISKPVVMELFGNRSKEEIMDLARRIGKNAIQNTAAAFMKDTGSDGRKLLDLNSFLSWLESEMNNYSTEIRHIVTDNGSHHTYILKHGAGGNYSLYYQTVLESIFDGALKKHIDITASNNTTLAFEFENK
jgi:hypothetical protein